MIKSINHVTLSVSDIHQSILFYRDMLGLTLEASWPKGAYLTGGDLWLALNLEVDKAVVPIGGASHIAFQVSEENYKVFVEKLTKKGINPYKMNRSFGNSFYFKDPDGHSLELHTHSLKQRLDFMQFRFEKLTLEDEANYKVYEQEWLESGQTHTPLSSGPYPEALAKSQSIEKKETCPPGFVPGHLYAFKNPEGKIIGFLNVRLELNEVLLHRGGHVGYGLSPSVRGKGYAKEMLKFGLNVLKTYGVTQVLVTCDQANIKSSKTIESCGGILEDLILEQEVVFCRYWIDNSH